MKTSFKTNVYSIAQKIPKGKIATYGQLAQLAGNPRAARAVGMCMKHNPDTTTVPCHRVVASNGDLTGYSMGEGVKTKREKLEREGVAFLGKRVNLELSQWKFN